MTIPSRYQFARRRLGVTFEQWKIVARSTIPNNSRDTCTSGFECADALTVGHGGDGLHASADPSANRSRNRYTRTRYVLRVYAREHSEWCRGLDECAGDLCRAVVARNKSPDRVLNFDRADQVGDERDTTVASDGTTTGQWRWYTAWRERERYRWVLVRMADDRRWQIDAAAETPWLSRQPLIFPRERERENWITTESALEKRQVLPRSPASLPHYSETRARLTLKTIDGSEIRIYWQRNKNIFAAKESDENSMDCLRSLFTRYVVSQGT